jgi:heme exporter protein D
MSYVTNQTTADSVRQRMEILRNFHTSALRAGEERLRAAMEEYARQFRVDGGHEAA